MPSGSPQRARTPAMVSDSVSAAADRDCHSRLRTSTTACMRFRNRVLEAQASPLSDASLSSHCCVRCFTTDTSCSSFLVMYSRSSSNAAPQSARYASSSSRSGDGTRSLDGPAGSGSVGTLRSVTCGLSDISGAVKLLVRPNQAPPLPLLLMLSTCSSSVMESSFDRGDRKDCVRDEADSDTRRTAGAVVCSNLVDGAVGCPGSSPHSPHSMPSPGSSPSSSESSPLSCSATSVSHSSSQSPSAAAAAIVAARPYNPSQRANSSAGRIFIRSTRRCGVSLCPLLLRVCRRESSPGLKELFTGSNATSDCCQYCAVPATVAESVYSQSWQDRA
mmetsp:Transcript_2787/g.7369  ORF Transcript_2787/g.7369 Transcript_2787/m.7369 type:complete len:332 (-) Transcript_2787:97-1092(-)